MFKWGNADVVDHMISLVPSNMDNVPILYPHMPLWFYMIFVPTQLSVESRAPREP
jgi:hypothetical protein